MQPGDLVAGDIKGYTSSVLVNGLLRPHLSWAVDRDLSGDLPAQVVASSGIAQASGSVSFAGEDVDAGGRNPWNSSTGWLPKPGDRVQIYAGDAATSWVQFTGRIDRVSGSVRDGFNATLIDDYDKLSARVTHEPLLRVMPPTSVGNPYRAVGLSALYFIDFALRKSGFHSTPKLEERPALSIPMQSSMWPEIGGMTSGVVSGGDGGPWASTYAAPWGAAMGDVLNTYDPALKLSMTTAVQVTLVVAPSHAGNTSVSIYYGAADNVSLAVAGSRTVIARVNGAEVCRVVMGSATLVSLLIKAGTWTLKTGNGTTATGAATNPTPAAMDRIIVNADVDSRVAGLQVSHPAAVNEFASLAHTPTAVYDLSNQVHMGIIDASPAIDGRRASELLDEISQATLSGMWIDEAGIFRWASAAALRAKGPSRTFTTLNDVLDLEWESSLLGLRSTVTMRTKRPVISKGAYQNKILYEGGSASMTSKEVSEELVGPGPDKDWIQPDESMTVLGSGNWGEYNTGRGTFGGVFYSSNGETLSPAGLGMSISMDKIGVTQYKIRHAAGTYPSDVVANIATSPTDAALWGRNQDRPLPVIRGYGKVQWADIERPTVPAAGVGPELVHDSGYWNNRADSDVIVDRIGDYLASQVSLPSPTITGLEVSFDPRLQLGDVINVNSPDLLGITMRALVVGVGASAGGAFSQSLSVRTISATSTFQTYAEYTGSLSGTMITYDQWDALAPSPESYATFNTSKGD